MWLLLLIPPKFITQTDRLPCRHELLAFHTQCGTRVLKGPQKLSGPSCVSLSIRLGLIAESQASLPKQAFLIYNISKLLDCKRATAFLESAVIDRLEHKKEDSMVSRGSGSGRREAASTEEPAIPLLCDLCPKKGQFSDISHLLTHISSKGHLSCRFTTDMKAKAGDINAAKKMRDFEKWYAENGIDGLLQDRITSKERRVKKSRGQGGLATVSARYMSIAGSSYKQMIEANVLQTRTARSQPSRHASVKSEPTEDMESMRWEFGPMRLRPTNTGRHSQSVFETPTTRRTRSSAQFPDFDKKIDKFGKWETFETEFSDVTDLIYLDTTEDIYESTVSKLKGIKYPGMAVFDSATPDQRRKRNQRKHESVITNMKRSSEAIEPTECIWQGIGNFERSRDIYATPSVDGSPVS